MSSFSSILPPAWFESVLLMAPLSSSVSHSSCAIVPFTSFCNPFSTNFPSCGPVIVSVNLFGFTLWRSHADCPCSGHQFVPLAADDVNRSVHYYWGLQHVMPKMAKLYWCTPNAINVLDYSVYCVYGHYMLLQGNQIFHFRDYTDPQEIPKSFGFGPFCCDSNRWMEYIPNNSFSYYMIIWFPTTRMLESIAGLIQWHTTRTIWYTWLLYMLHID